MARTPLRLSGPSQLTNAAATQFTVPAVTKYVVRHMHFDNPGASINLTVSIGADAAAKRIFDAFPIPTGPYDHFCYYVMEAAEILQAFASTTLQIVMTVDGDVITLG